MKGVVAILTDTTRCIGCEACVEACKEENRLGPDRALGRRGPADSLSPARLCTILRRPGGRFVRQQCRHCLEPACAAACPVGALRRTPEGAVVYNAKLCIGCRYCMLACPYGIPRYEWDRTAPLVTKCTLCHPRIAEGRMPACVEVCPAEALSFGPRGKMLSEARRRIARNPRSYLDRIDGEKEIGGSCVLYVSDVPLDFLAEGAALGERPLPDLTWTALKKVPAIVLLAGGLLGGIYWIIGRRMKLQAEAELGTGEDSDET